MTMEIQTRTEPELNNFQVIERVITKGDLAQMTPADRVSFYWRTCESLGLNPLTRPFEFINLNGKLTMYARKDATDQLRKLNAVSVTKLERERTDDMMLVTAYGRDRTGRDDSAMGAVSIKGLSGEALANALMKAETKAKRRLTLSLVGLGFLDETEIEGAERVDVDPTTGEITAKPAPRTLLEAVHRQQEKLADPVIEASAVLDELPGAEPDDPGPAAEIRPQAAPIPAPAAQDVPPEPVAARPAAAPRGAKAEPPATLAAPPMTFKAFSESIRSSGAIDEDIVEAARNRFPTAKTISGLADDERGRLFVDVMERVEARQAAAASA